MPVATNLVLPLLKHDYPFRRRDFPTMLITKQTDCSCDANEHTFTTVSVDEQDEMTLERRMCVCTGCFECEAREVRVIPHTASSGRRYADPIA